MSSGLFGLVFKYQLVWLGIHCAKLNFRIKAQNYYQS